MMKLLWLSHLLPFPPKGGVVQRSYNLIRETSREHDVLLCAFNQKAWLADEAALEAARREFSRFCSYVQVFELPSEKSRWTWYRLLARSFLGPESYTVNWTKSPQMQEEVYRLIRGTPIDLVHCDTLGLAEYVKDLGHMPKVLNHHNIESHMMLRRATNEANVLKKLYFSLEAVKLRRYERKKCRLFDLNLTVSQLDRERLIARDRTLNVAVIPNGVDTNYFLPHTNKVIRHNLVFAARMNAYTNEDAVLWFLSDIWPTIKKAVPDVSLTLAGRNPTLKMRRLAANDPGVLLTGYVDDIRPLVGQAEIYVCPMRDGGGTKLKMLDAMAMGKPIVCTSLAAEGLDIVSGEHVLVADSPRAFADGVLNLFRDEALKSKLACRGREVVERLYAWPSIGRTLNRGFGDVVRVRKGGSSEKRGRKVIQ
jgi:sugar transferase (PEP-CTERM/EpsH1 system associated)